MIHLPQTSVQRASNEAALKAWLISLINAGETQATLYVTNKYMIDTAHPTGADPLPSRNSNKIFNSKERANLANGSDFGAYTPKLFINATGEIPEPTTLALAGLTVALLAVGRRRG